MRVFPAFFTDACGALSRSAPPQHTPGVAEPHASPSSPQPHHQTQGEHPHEGQETPVRHIPDIFHVTLRNHITLIILSVKMALNEDQLYLES